MNSNTVVLLVDDEKMVLDSLKQQIRGLFGPDLECETAENAEEAWEVLEELMAEDEGRVILVVSDWLMPRVKGDELLEKVRDRYPNISRVLLTGQADPEVLARLQSEGLLDALLFKPWQAETLEKTVASALER